MKAPLWTVAGVAAAGTALVALVVWAGPAAATDRPLATIPAPDAPATLAEQHRVERLAVAAHFADPATTTCAARVLRVEPGRTLAWRRCTSTTDGGQGGSSGPVVVDGDRLREPRDGAGYGDDVRAWFPGRLADLVLAQDPRVTSPDPVIR